MQIALHSPGVKGYSVGENNSEAEIYGFWANKKRIVTYATVEFF